MRILILPGYRYPASLDEPLICGDLRNTFNLSRAFVRAGHEVAVLTRRGPHDPASQVLDGVQVHRYRPELGAVLATSFDVSARRLRLFRALRREADVVLASTPLSLELLTRDAAPLFYVCSGIEDVRNYGRSASESVAGLGIRMLRDPARRRTWRRARRVNTTAEKEVDTLVRLGVPRDRVLTIGPGVELERYQPARADAVLAMKGELLPEHARGRRLVLSVSRFTPAKGILETLRAFARLKAGYPGAFLLLVGVRHSHRADYSDQVRRTIAALGLRDDVAIRENLAEAMLPACYAAADVTSVFSVGYDPLPTVIIESMACGTPVVSTDFATRAQMIAHGADGLLVPEGDEGAWVTAVRRILEDDALAGRLREHGLARVRRQFDMNAVAARWLDAFRAA